MKKDHISDNLSPSRPFGGDLKRWEGVQDFKVTVCASVIFLPVKSSVGKRNMEPRHGHSAAGKRTTPFVYLFEFQPCGHVLSVEGCDGTGAKVWLCVVRVSELICYCEVLITSTVS